MQKEMMKKYCLGRAMRIQNPGGFETGEVCLLQKVFGYRT